MQPQMQPQIQQIQQVEPNLINSFNISEPISTQLQIEEKSVTFNDVVEEKIITPTDNSFTNLTEFTQFVPPVDTIKKVKIGKLMVPKSTVIFTVAMIIISIVLFVGTKPKSKKSKKREEDEQ